MKTESGFTLLESIVGIGLLGLVALFLYGLPGLFSSTQKSMISVITKDQVFKGFAQTFIDTAAKADVALHFEYLPINTACSGSGPCVQKLVNGIFQAAALPFTSLQFFSDEAAVVTPTFLNNPSDPSASTTGWFAFGRQHLTLPSSIVNGDYYATWTLSSASSPAFPLLVRSNAVNSFFTIAGNFVTSGAISSSDWVIAVGPQPGVAVGQLVGHPMVIYNANDPTQYMIRRLANAYDCTTTVSAVQASCTTAAQSILGAGVTPGTPPLPRNPSDPFFTTDNYYALQLQPIAKSDLGAYLPSGTAPPTPWSGQDPGLYLFPTLQMSMGWVGANNPDPLDFTAPSVNNMAHAYHTWPAASQGNLVILPIELKRYYLVSHTDSKGVVLASSLEVDTFGGSHPVDVLDQVNPRSSLVFSRKLGTTEFGVLEMQ